MNLVIFFLCKRLEQIRLMGRSQNKHSGDSLFGVEWGRDTCICMDFVQSFGNTFSIMFLKQKSNTVQKKSNIPRICQE